MITIEPAMGISDAVPQLEAGPMQLSQLIQHAKWAHLCFSLK